MKLDFEEVAVAGLWKSYGPTLALTGVDLELQRGSVTAILGANGSGKSTLLWLLALLAHPTRGEIRYGVHGPDEADRLRARIGFVAHQLQLYPGLSGRENLLLAGRLQSIPYADKRANDLSDAFSLHEFWNRPLRTYSRGQAQRVAIARALMHEPRLLLMDEPSTGLDERASEALVSLIAQEKQQGSIVVIVSHEIGFAENVADRILRIDRGKIVGNRA